ncbi:MAG: PASTA domain-containing protein [Phototrophicaceae bacterium]
MTIFAQDDNVTVPDLTGLNVPQAAATLNLAGLALGIENAVDLATGNGLAAGLISTQSIAANTSVARGSAVDVNVLRSDNAQLLYDDNDITVINTTNNIGNITGLRFAAVEGTSPASFAATRWGSNVRENGCLQLWSIVVRNAKSVTGCDTTQWLTTNVTGEHFWTQVNGVQQFAVIEDGIERATCDAAPAGSQDNPLSCTFYLSGAGSADDITTYLRFEYTPTAITIVNPTTDRWMPTDRTTIFNFNPNIENQGASLLMGDAALFQNPEIVADITELAPQQCLLLTSDNEGGAAPQDCDVIAQRNLSSTVAFWLADFEVESATTASRHTCPAASAERLTICIVPQ